MQFPGTAARFYNKSRKLMHFSSRSVVKHPLPSFLMHSRSGSARAKRDHYEPTPPRAHYPRSAGRGHKLNQPVAASASLAVNSLEPHTASPRPTPRQLIDAPPRQQIDCFPYICVRKIYISRRGETFSRKLFVRIENANAKSKTYILRLSD